jgi:hypothetical protein
MDASDYLGVPEGYATPEQIKDAQTFAQLLMKQANSQNLIRSPWQGVSNIVNATMGGYMARQAALADLAARRRGTANQWNAGPGAPVPSGGTVPPNYVSPNPNAPNPAPQPSVMDTPGMSGPLGMFAWPQTGPSGYGYWGQS